LFTLGGFGQQPSNDHELAKFKYADVFNDPLDINAGYDLISIEDFNISGSIGCTIIRQKPLMFKIRPLCVALSKLSTNNSKL
jgi:hypothetical protein